MKRTVQLAQKPALNFYELATNLSGLHDIDLSLIRDIPERSRIKRRRLYYLLEVGRLLREHQISKAYAEAVGWTKLQIIARHFSHSGDPEEKLKEFMQLARDTQAKSLAKALSGTNVHWSRAVQLTLNRGAKAELDEALLAFGAKRTGRGLVRKDAALREIIRAAMKQKGLGYR